MAYYTLQIDYMPGQWAELMDRGGAIVEAVDREVALREGRLHLFWPSEEAEVALLIVEGPLTLPDAARAIAARARGSLELVEYLEVEFPQREITSLEEAALLARAAFRGQLIRCTGCGRATPPHLDDCPFRQVEETVEAVAWVEAPR